MKKIILFLSLLSLSNFDLFSAYDKTKKIYGNNYHMTRSTDKKIFTQDGFVTPDVLRNICFLMADPVNTTVGDFLKILKTKIAPVCKSWNEQAHEIFNKIFNNTKRFYLPGNRFDSSMILYAIYFDPIMLDAFLNYYNLDLNKIIIEDQNLMYYALRVAYIRKNTESLIILLKHGLNINLRDYDGTTSLWMAIVIYNNPEITEFLLENGADPNIKNFLGYSLMHRLFDYYYDKIKFVPLLLKYGADPNILKKSPTLPPIEGEIVFTPLEYGFSKFDFSQVYASGELIELIKFFIDEPRVLNYVKDCIAREGKDNYFKTRLDDNRVPVEIKEYLIKKLMEN